MDATGQPNKEEPQPMERFNSKVAGLKSKSDSGRRAERRRAEEKRAKSA